MFLHVLAPFFLFAFAFSFLSFAFVNSTGPAQMFPDSVSHAGPAQSSHTQHLTQSIEMADYDHDFQDLLKQLHLPEEVRDSLLQNGYDCTLTFGLAFSSMQMPDQHIQKFLPPGETDLTSATCARIRALWSKCNNLHTTAPLNLSHLHLPLPFFLLNSAHIQWARNRTTQTQH